MHRSMIGLGLVCLAAHGVASGAAAQTLADYDYEYLNFRGVGVHAGYIWPNKVEETVHYGLRLDMGYLGPGVRIIPSIGYWRSEVTRQELQDLATRFNEQTGSSVDADDLGPIDWSDLSFSLDGHFVWNLPFQALTYLGAGVGFHALNGQGPAIDDTLIEDLLDVLTAGVSGMAGIEIEPIDRFRVYAEGRYTALNSMQYLSAVGGLQFMFGLNGDGRSAAALPAPGMTEAREMP